MAAVVAMRPLTQAAAARVARTATALLLAHLASIMKARAAADQAVVQHHRAPQAATTTPDQGAALAVRRARLTAALALMVVVAVADTDRTAAPIRPVQAERAATAPNGQATQVG